MPDTDRNAPGLNEKKLVEAIKFFLKEDAEAARAAACKSFPHDRISQTKMHKLLFFSDFGHVQEHGAPITNSDYERWTQGPVAVNAIHAIGGLVEPVMAGTTARPKRNHGEIAVQVAEAAMDDELQPVETETLGKVWRAWGNHSTGEIVQASRELTSAFDASPQNRIGYNLAYLAPDVIGHRQK